MTKEHEILLATYYCELDELRKMIGKNFDPYIFKDLSLFGTGDPDYGWECHEKTCLCPIYYLSMALRQILKYDWKFDYMKFETMEMRKNNFAVLEFWEKECGFDINQEIDFYSIYATYMSMTEPYEFDWHDMETYLSDGGTEKDVNLFKATLFRDYKRVKRLLEEGANPLIHYSVVSCSAAELAHARTSCDDGFAMFHDDIWKYVHRRQKNPDYMKENSHLALFPIEGSLELALDVIINDMIKEYL